MKRLCPEDELFKYEQICPLFSIKPENRPEFSTLDELNVSLGPVMSIKKIIVLIWSFQLSTALLLDSII